MNKLEKILGLRPGPGDRIKSYQARRAYIKTLNIEPFIAIDDEVFEYIAGLGALSARELEGIYARLVYHAKVFTYDNHITVEEAKLALRRK